jgi:hypothetical protein
MPAGPPSLRRPPLHRYREGGLPGGGREPALQQRRNGGTVERRLTAYLSGRLSRVDAPGGSRAPG